MGDDDFMIVKWFLKLGTFHVSSCFEISTSRKPKDTNTHLKWHTSKMENPDTHLKWSVLRKYLTAFSR